MKVLISYYSLRTHTKRVAEKIAKHLDADIETIIDKKDRRHLVTWHLSSFDEELKTPTTIAKPKLNSSEYDLVIIGTPIWDGITPAVKKYLQTNKFKKVAFFITFAASAEDAAYKMSHIINKNPISILELQDREIDRNEANKKIDKFCQSIKHCR